MTARPSSHSRRRTDLGGMKLLIAAAVLLVLGTVGVVVLHERGKAHGHGPASDASAAVATISTGDRVDIEAHVPRRGLTIVEFTADF